MALATLHGPTQSLASQALWPSATRQMRPRQKFSATALISPSVARAAAHPLQLPHPHPQPLPHQLPPALILAPASAQALQEPLASAATVPLEGTRTYSTAALEASGASLAAHSTCSVRGVSCTYDTASGGICNWAANVRCDGSRVAPASASARNARRSARAPCGGRAVPCMPATLGEQAANMSAVPAQTAAQGEQSAGLLAVHAASTSVHPAEGDPTAMGVAASEASGGVVDMGVAVHAATMVDAEAATDGVPAGDGVVAPDAAAAAESG